MVAVLGISESSKADLLAQLDQLGTNLLRVAPGPVVLRRGSGAAGGVGGDDRGASPAWSRSPRARPWPAQTVRRNPYVDEAETGGISVVGRRPRAAATRSARRCGAARFLNAATGRYPTVVLGAEAAATLGIDDAGARVWIGGRWFTVVGILEPVTLAPAARQHGADRLRRRRGAVRRGGQPVERSTCAPTRTRIATSRDLLGATANPRASGGGRGLAPVGRARGARGGQDRVHVAVPRARRGGAARRRRRDRERDGDLGARAPLGDRAAARARRDAAQRRRAVPGRVAAARGCGRRRRHAARRARDVRLRELRGLDRGGAGGGVGRWRAGGGVCRRRGGAVPGAAGGAVVADGGAALR